MPRVLALAILVALVAACGASADGSPSVAIPTTAPSVAPSIPDASPTADASVEPSASPSVEPTPTETATATPAATPGETMIVRAYFVLGGPPGSVGLVPVLRVMPKTAVVATAAMTALLGGPTAAEAGDRAMTTAVPDGTELLGVTIKSGVATVDLSTEFGAADTKVSMNYRLAQVVYTLTQFSTVKKVVFRIDGKIVTVFGNDGIVLQGPVGRAEYYDQLPAIFVDRPAFGAAIGNPGRIAGNADVFEATFQVALLDTARKVLIEQQVKATCGTGCRGTFDVMVPYTVTKGQWGTLRAFDLSAKDGTPENVREYPVWLTPAS